MCQNKSSANLNGYGLEIEILSMEKGIHVAGQIDIKS